jgi:hypothetical protein
MTSTTASNGRLGNQIIRNLAVSFIAEKFNLRVNYANFDLINSLGIQLFCGENKYTDSIPLTDNNFFSIYNGDILTCNLNPNCDFFQTKEITNFIYKYLHTENIKAQIIKKNPFKSRYNNNNDLFIHIRLTDVAHNNPGSYYYLNTINTIQFDNLYLSTDDPNHTIIHEIKKHFPAVSIINYDEIATIQFASTNKHILLSHGSFSAIVGYLSFFSTVHYPEYEPGKIWYGDMFSIDGWIQHKYL